jgi:predicted small metal-binding protein
MKMNSRSSQSPPSVDITNVKVYRFQCGHEQCGSQVDASTMDELRLLIAQHLNESHSVHKVSDTLINYLESTCVTVLPS